MDIELINLRRWLIRIWNFFGGREAWRMNVPTEELDLRKYARCEWKCIYACIQIWYGQSLWLSIYFVLQARVNALQRTAGRQLKTEMILAVLINGNSQKNTLLNQIGDTLGVVGCL